MPLPRAFSALRERNFAIFYAGFVLSGIGTWMERAALAWLIYRLTDDSETWLGLAMGAPLIPALLLSLPAGIVVDRVRIRSLLFATQTGMLLGAAVIAWLTLTERVEAWHVVAYAVYASAVFTVDAPARHAFIVRLVGREEITNAFALNAVAYQVAHVGGAALFGVLMATTDLGEGGCLALNVVSFFFVLISLFFVRETAPPAPRHERGRMLDGVRHALRTPIIRAALMTAVTTAMFGFMVSQLLVVYAKSEWHGTADDFAWLRGAMAVGAFAGGIFLAARSRVVQRGRLLLICGLLIVPLLIAFAHAGGVLPGSLLVVTLGFLLIQCHAGASSMVQSHAPDQLRGRISSLFTMCVLTCFPLGGLLGGLAAERFGAPRTTTVAAVISLVLIATIHTTHPTFRRAA